jgi:hypothetical protein
VFGCREVQHIIVADVGVGELEHLSREPFAFSSRVQDVQLNQQGTVPRHVGDCLRVCRELFGLFVVQHLVDNPI